MKNNKKTNNKLNIIYPQEYYNEDYFKKELEKVNDNINMWQNNYYLPIINLTQNEFYLLARTLFKTLLDNKKAYLFQDKFTNHIGLILAKAVHKNKKRITIIDFLNYYQEELNLPNNSLDEEIYQRQIIEIRINEQDLSELKITKFPQVIKKI